MKKVFVIVLTLLAAMLISGCSFGRVNQCRKEHPGCRWNCELQYGWTGYHGDMHDELVQKAAVEQCYW